MLTLTKNPIKLSAETPGSGNRTRLPKRAPSSTSCFGRRLLSTFGILAACMLLSGCMSTKKDPNAEAEAYLAFLKARPGADLNGPDEKAAIDRVKTYLSNLRDPKTLESTAQVYSEDAFFNDTIKTEIGARKIEEYFKATAENTDAIEVEIQDVARSNNDYYLRWVMDVKFKKFDRGKTFRSIGMTHIRFGPDGKVILHQDYWDSASGLFERIPILGSGIRWIKAMF